MENSLNILHYCIYLVDCKSHFLSNKINPLLLLYKLPFAKRRFKKLGFEDPMEAYNSGFTDKNFGYSIMVSGGAMAGIVAIFLVSLYGILMNKLYDDYILSLNHFILFALLAYLICYLLVFKKDKYLIYFEKYETWTRFEKRKYVLLSLGFIVGVIIIFFISLLAT